MTTFDNIPLLIPGFAIAYLLVVYLLLALLARYARAWRRPES